MIEMRLQQKSILIHFRGLQDFVARRDGGGSGGSGGSGGRKSGGRGAKSGAKSSGRRRRLTGGMGAAGKGWGI